MYASKRHRFWMSMLVAASGLAGSAQAVEFDPAVKSPMVSSPSDIGTRAVDVAKRLASLRDAAPLQIVTDPALSRDQFDLAWRLQMLSDEKRAVGELSALGVEDRGDGVLHIDTKSNPGWRNVAQTICSELPRANWEVFGPDLVARGFRPEDVTNLQDYLAGHDYLAATRKPLAEITVSFRKLVLAYDKIRKPVPDSLVMAFLYQRAAAHSDAKQKWASGVLGSLDPQRARILLSYFQDREMSSTTYFPDDRRAGIDGVLADVRRPDFNTLLKQQMERSAP
jgi:hypothetical protein